MNYKVALYIRLSREDEDKDNQSESIINQESLLLQYVKENNLEVYDTYIDDGYSGTTFDRPAFNRLIKDIEDKKINMVITKDMSRLGRDYIGTGNLVEKYFPQNNVRYIAVTDNIDTFLDSTNNDIAPFKAIMNDMYAKDISKKIRTSLKAKMKEGKYVGARPPYGYKKDNKDKNKLIIDEEKSVIVKRIFDLSLKGYNPSKIANILSEENIKSPSEYYDYLWQNKEHIRRWNAKTVKDILTNRIYTGDMVQNKRNKINYKVNKIISNDTTNYIVIENIHTPIVDKETFNKVQRMLPQNKFRKEKKENYLLDGLLYCSECGHRISITPRRKKDNRCYTICNYYRTYIKEKVCTPHSNNYDILEKEILLKLKESYIMYLDKEKIKKEVINRLNKEDKNNIIEEQKNLIKEINNIKDNLDTIYLDKINNKIDNEQYQRIKEKLENILKIQEEKISKINKEIINQKDKKINLDTYFKEEYISRELVINLIERIEISKDKIINIKFTFSNKP